jgi:hypothetical protein
LIAEKKNLAVHSVDFEQSFVQHKQWKFEPIMDRFIRNEERSPIGNAFAMKKYMRQRQRLSAWYLLFNFQIFH